MKESGGIRAQKEPKKGMVADRRYTCNEILKGLATESHRPALA
jgi:hypothetical protein